MAADAARHRLEGTGVLSCRIKITHSHPDPARAAAENTQKSHPQQSSMSEMVNAFTTNGSRRNDKLADAIQSMVNLNSTVEFDSPIDPDAQATVTDFLDFTEYLPADMKRSCTLINNLDEVEHKASAGVHELTKVWGKPQDVPLDEKPDLVNLRAQISQTLGEAVRARTLSYTEAQRMSHNVEQHYIRAKNILAKLQTMLENYPTTRENSPALQKSVSPIATRAPLLKSREEHGGHKIRKHRAPRITVPGEVLAPYELDYESYGSESDTSESDGHVMETRNTPAVIASSNGRIKLKISKVSKDKDKEKVPKPPRQPRPPGVMGTNVHSAVAGISTTNALAKLKPPPPDAKKGSEDLPWLQLTDWELGMLRKRMKKNAVWSPSDTMIARELKVLGRGIEAYRMAKKEADAIGQPLDQPTPPQLLGQTVHAEGAISVEAVIGDQEVPVTNRGMKLNEAKKLKKENQQKEQQTKAADDTAEAVRRMTESAEALKNIFNAPTLNNKKAATKPVDKTPAKKRKRESVAPNESTEKPPEVEPLATKSDKAERPPPPKRTKTETPIPLPPPITRKDSKASTPVSSAATPVAEPAASVTSDAVSHPTKESSVDNTPTVKPTPIKVSTPILPPGKQLRKDVKREVKKEVKDIQPEPKKVEAPTNTRPSRSTAASKAPTPVPEPLPAKRPTSSRSKAASTEPPSFPTTATATIDRPRRSSTARNTPAPPAPVEPRQANKRTKRPAPGVVTADSEGSAAVSVGKRSSATRKKAGAKKEKKDGREGSAAQEVYDEFDDEGNLIDPDEPRYCLCNRVSFGTMIGCENNECEKEWFHLECVGLTDIPPRTTKWYCPDCRKKLNLGERGEVTARGKKK
ncbi:hypothetical protein B0O99DRAFT_686551 [Bisporella sp. PMI_857]|nr:hypothetical protein B0O99DRAFT_686551 [Bisporella sp. PMI_857]